ncbi:MAG TPA: transglutaminase domain-containing protein [Dehalococcoidia bacterium]
MRQASWDEIQRMEEIFRARRDVPAPPPPRWMKVFSFFSWEEAVTLLIVLIAFLDVVQSINTADWVPEMPSLFTMAFLGLGLGLLLARLGLPELPSHLFALVVGAAGVVLNVAGQLQGSLSSRVSDLFDRIYIWGEALFTGGISNDNIPFVLLVVSATYLTAYMSAWSIFRWYNAWVGLIPGGLALLTNLSYLPGQKSVPLIIYLFCAIILVARVNLLRSARDWRQQRTRYPDTISLHVLNVTVWVGIGLLAMAWILPVGHGSGLLYSAWQRATAPIAEPLSDLGRVFSAINSKKGGSVHQFGSTLPLRGEVTLGGGPLMEVTATEPGLLRAQTYDYYLREGWKVGPSVKITSGTWPALKVLQTAAEAQAQRRRPVSVQVTTTRKSNVIVSAGQPLSVSVDTRVVFGADQADIASLRPVSTLAEGDQYRVDSTVSAASEGQLRGAPTTYPSWLDPYLQLPSDLPRNIRVQAAQQTSQASNPYDRAVAIERYLRTFAIDTKIRPAPPKRDSVEYFLFDLRRGYFDYHASAMVVMLRTLGIPARLAVGYVIRPEDRVQGTSVYMVSDANSFAWPEVYFPGLGWVEFNPTPSEPLLVRSDTDAAGGDIFDPSVFLDPGALDALPGAGAAGPALDALQIEEESNTVSRIIGSVIVGLLALSVLAFAIFQYSWQRGLRGLAYPVQVWEKTLRLAKWARVRPLPQETPHEILERLRRELPEVEDIDYLGASFVRSRYGQKELSAEEQERLTAVWQRARNTLLSRFLRLK